MTRPSRFSPEVRTRAVRMVLEHEAAHDSQWAAITSIAEKIGCTAETLRKWVRQAERDQGTRPGLTTEERQRLKQLERENFELRRANEILKKAAAFFAQAELDRRARLFENLGRELGQAPFLRLSYTPPGARALPIDAIWINGGRAFGHPSDDRQALRYARYVDRLTA